MKVNGIKIYYPNGQTMLELGELEGSWDEIARIAAAGMNDVLSKMPEMTSKAADFYNAWEMAKRAQGGGTR